MSPSGSTRLLLAPLVALTAAVASLALDEDQGALMLVELHRTVAESSERIADLEREREGLLQRIRALRSDPLTLETVAREQLGMLRPGERVLRWDPDGIAR